MDQKILILGAKGMLGSALAKVFSDKNPILLDYLELDIADQKNLEEKLNELKPTLIINAAAYTDVDGAESNKELAMKVNGEAVGYLAEVAKKLGAILIHYSTDYVFDGEKKEDHSTRNWLIGGAIAIVVGGIVYWISLDDNGKIGETGTYIDDPHTGVGGR